MNPILSILVPTRNRAWYLQHAVTSAIAIADKDIEIVVSNNRSEDNTLEVLKNFADSRLRYSTTPSLLPMHSNFELLLQQARGEWIYVLGDDDAMMPYAAKYLKYLTRKYPACEAVVTTRALYYWKACWESKPRSVVGASLSVEEEWIDSKRMLKCLLNATRHYFSAPQHYSGGVHRRSLVNRVLRAQDGTFYKSVTPDAYSAVMGCLHTDRFLRTDIPIAWVGTSDGGQQKGKKDRNADFYDLHNEGDLVMHKAVGDLREYTLPLVFFEAYLSAIPTASAAELNRRRLRVLAADARKTFKNTRRDGAFQDLANYLGFRNTELAIASFLLEMNRSTEYALSRLKRLPNKLKRVFGHKLLSWRPQIVSDSYELFPDINAANGWAEERYYEFENLMR